MQREEIEQRILRYVADHADSADTLEGIVTWWILRENIDQKIAEVRGALDHLVARGVLVESVVAGSRITYRVNKQKNASGASASRTD